jgi:hypothetical protein
MRLHFDFATIFFLAIEQPPAALHQRENVDNCDAQLALRDQEIRQRLLMLGIDLHQDHVFGIVIGDDELPHQPPVGIIIVAAEINPKLRRQAIRLDILVRGGSLISVEGREGLQLDQLGLQLAVYVAHQTEVHLHEHRQRRLVGNVVFGRDGDIRSAAVFRIVHQLRD